MFAPKIHHYLSSRWQFSYTRRSSHTDLFLELQLISDASDLCRGWLTLPRKVCFERALDGHLDTGSFLALPALRRHLVEARRRCVARVRLVQPVGKQRLQLTHVLETQLRRHPLHTRHIIFLSDQVKGKVHLYSAASRIFRHIGDVRHRQSRRSARAAAQARAHEFWPAATAARSPSPPF